MIDVVRRELPGTVLSRGYADWEVGVVADFETNAFNVWVGQRLLSQGPRLRVWESRLGPGDRLPAHRHVLDYTWVALCAGRSIQHTGDGTTRQVAYRPGETRHTTFTAGQYLLHDLHNVGDAELRFITLEHLDGANPPLDLGSAERTHS